MSNRDTNLLLGDIIEAGNKIKKYTKGLNFETYLEDDKTIDAVIRNFEIIGEAANRIDIKFKNENKNIPWNRLRGFRNRLVHTYFGIDQEIVWNIINESLDDMINQIKKIHEDN
jgi:uncharacterized protein with HEPN domain